LSLSLTTHQQARAANIALNVVETGVIAAGAAAAVVIMNKIEEINYKINFIKSAEERFEKEFADIVYDHEDEVIQLAKEQEVSSYLHAIIEKKETLKSLNTKKWLYVSALFLDGVVCSGIFIKNLFYWIVTPRDMKKTLDEVKAIRKERYTPENCIKGLLKNGHYNWRVVKVHEEQENQPVQPTTQPQNQHQDNITLNISEEIREKFYPETKQT